MRCSNCGKEFAPADASVEIRHDRPVRVSTIGLPIKITTAVLCQDCAKSRSGARRTIIWVTATFLTGILVIALVDVLLRLLH